MVGLLDRLGRAFLFRFDPEVAHRMAIRGLAVGAHAASPRPDPRLATRAMGLEFPSPVGLAAGFDKNAEAVDGLLKLGFGFVEVGTVTPLPQPGNAKPRMFRLEPDRAIINRLGFNNDGMMEIRRRLAARSARGGVVGINLGANKDSVDRVGDYVAGVEAFARTASYLTINISSPNTPGLRRFQEAEALSALLTRIVAARDEATNGSRQTPLLVKVAPDLDEGAASAIAEVALAAGIEGLIVTNTTLDRKDLIDRENGGQVGGLSGRPLFRRSTMILAKLRKLVGAQMVLVGVGGIESGDTAWTKLAAGADLIQVYTGMIYEGHRIAADINRDLARRLSETKLPSIAAVVGTETERWAALPW